MELHLATKHQYGRPPQNSSRRTQTRRTRQLRHETATRPSRRRQPPLAQQKAGPVRRMSQNCREEPSRWGAAHTQARSATRCRTRQRSEVQPGQRAQRRGRRPPQLARKKSSHSTARSTQTRMGQHCCLEGTSASEARWWRARLFVPKLQVEMTNSSEQRAKPRIVEKECEASFDGSALATKVKKTTDNVALACFTIKRTIHSFCKNSGILR